MELSYDFCILSQSPELFHFSRTNLAAMSHSGQAVFPPPPISFPRSELNFPQMFLGLAYEILWFSETPGPRSINQQTQVWCSALAVHTDDATARE